ncbi:hypothetical protein HDU88_003244 [Geranomyces variabilis]|nr:hypothetical protein HDU88_003244 [Geranomyces variabilis]
MAGIPAPSVADLETQPESVYPAFQTISMFFSGSLEVEWDEYLLKQPHAVPVLRIGGSAGQGCQGSIYDTAEALNAAEVDAAEVTEEAAIGAAEAAEEAAADTVIKALTPEFLLSRFPQTQRGVSRPNDFHVEGHNISRRVQDAQCRLAFRAQQGIMPEFKVEQIADILLLNNVLMVEDQSFLRNAGQSQPAAIRETSGTRRCQF